MGNIVDIPRSFAKNRWFRLGGTLTLALGLALILLFIPITAGKAIRIPVPAWSQSALDSSSLSLNGYSGRTIDLSLPLGAEMVRATNGLTITKTADPIVVDQGGIITYTLVITNNTGVDVTDVTVTDTVPADTECADVIAAPQWAINGAANCKNDREAVWLLPSPSGTPSVGGVVADGSSVVLTYTVRVDQPLPNQSVITNAAFSYGVTVISPTTFNDSGTVEVTTTVNAPEWQISKSAVPTPTVQAGDSLTYTLTITNVGALTTSGSYNVVDTIPANTTFYAATGSYVQAGDTVTWTMSTPLGPGQATARTLVVKVDSPLTNGLTITNTGYRVFGANVYTGAVGPPVVSTVRSQSQLEASKTANAPTVTAGDLITYTLTVTNLTAATGPAQDVVVADPLPAEVLYEGMGFIPPAGGTMDNPGFGNTGVVTWTLSDAIQHGDSIQVYVVGRVASPLANGTSLVNTCVATATNALAPATCPLLANIVKSTPSLSLGKSVTPSANVSPGGTVTYTLVLSNTGNETATGVTVTDTLGSAFSPPVVIWTDVTVPGRPTYGSVGTQTLVFTASAPLIPGTYYNTAITATYASRQVTDTNLAPIVVGAPDLGIRKSVTPASVIAGQVLTYTIVYSNASGAPATGVWITDTLGANLTFVGATPPPDVLQPPDYAWDVGTLSQADGEQTIVVTARVAPDTPNGTIVGNSLVITSAQGVGASHGPVNATVLAPELHIVKSDAGYDPIDAGGVLTYTITYINTGDADAHNVRITDTLDANVSFAWASMTPDASSSPPNYVWVIGDLPANSGPQTLRVAVTVAQPLPDGTVLVNDVAMGGDEPFSDSHSITTTVQSAPLFQVSKTASPTPATPGELLTYTIVFTNVGNATATGVRITDTLDSNVTFQSSVPGISGSAGNQLYWDWPVPVGLDDPQTILVTVLVTSPLADGTLLWNSVEVDSSQGGTDIVTISTPVQSAPELHVTKTATPSVVQPGGTITYSITYSNTGTAVTDVVITDTLDSNVSFVDATSPYVLSPPNVIWNLAGLSPLSGTQALTVVVTAAPVLQDGALLINNVFIAGDGSNDSDTVTTTLEAVDLVVYKSAVPVADVQADEWITYTITFYNAGGMDATSVLITDTLPLSLTNVSYSASSGVGFMGGPPPYVWGDKFVAGNSTEMGVITITGQLLQTPWPSTGAWLINTVAISGNQAEAVTSNNLATVANLGVPGDPYTITLTPVPTETTVGTNVTVYASVTDQFGNPVRDGSTVNFTSLPVGSSVTPPSTTTSDGETTTTLTSVVSATVTVTATAGSAIDSADVIFHPGPLDHFAIGVTSPQTAGVAFTTVITALDQYGNIVDFGDTVTLADTTGTLIPSSPPSLVNGRGAISVTVYTATPADVITATWGITPIIGVSGPFEVLPGAPSALTVMVNPTAIRVCQTAAVTTTISDQWGNLLPSQPVTLTVFGAPPPPLGNATLSPAIGSTGSTGIFASTLQGTQAGNIKIYGESGSLNNAGSEPTASISDPPIPTSLSLSVSPNPLYTGGATAVVTATVTDCLGLSSGQVVTFTLSDTSLAWFPGPSDTYVATTNASGVATATLTSNSTPTAGILTITGSVEGLVDVINLNVELEPTPSLTITKTATPAGGNVRPGQTLNYTVVARNTGGAEATGVVISDTLPAGVGLVSRTASGGTIISDTPLIVTWALPAGGAITLTVEVTVTSEVSGTILNNQASLDSNETGPAFSQVVSHRVVTDTGTVFLPIILNNWDGTTPPVPPDVNLIIDDISFVGAPPTNDGDQYHVQVVVRNAGSDAVTTDFWVDLYLNPVSTPVPNQPWQNLSQSGVQGVSNCPTDPTCYGRAWLVTTDLAPGATVTLTTQAAADWRYDRWPADGVPYVSSRHNPILALVDSWGFSYGAVSESNEGDNLSNSLLGSGLGGNQSTLGLPESGIPAWPPGSQRPSLPPPKE